MKTITTLTTYFVPPESGAAVRLQRLVRRLGQYKWALYVERFSGFASGFPPSGELGKLRKEAPMPWRARMRRMGTWRYGRTLEEVLAKLIKDMEIHQERVCGDDSPNEKGQR